MSYESLDSPNLPSDCWYEISRWCDISQLLTVLRISKEAACGSTRLVKQNKILLFHTDEIVSSVSSKFLRCGDAADDEYHLAPPERRNPNNNRFYQMVKSMIDKRKKRRKNLMETDYETIQNNMQKLNDFLSGPDYNILKIGDKVYYTKIGDTILKLSVYPESDGRIVLSSNYLEQIPVNEFWRYEDILFYSGNNYNYIIVTCFPEKYNVKKSDLIYSSPNSISGFFYKEKIFEADNMYGIRKPEKKQTQIHDIYSGPWPVVVKDKDPSWYNPWYNPNYESDSDRYECREYHEYQYSYDSSDCD